MNDHPLHLALRKVHASFRTPAVWTGMIAAGMILGIAGPFGTAEVMHFVPRVVYWLVLTICSFGLGSLVGTTVGETLKQAGVSLWLSVVLAGMAVGIDVTILVMALNWLVFGLSPFDMTYALILAGNVIAVSVVVTVATVLFSDQTHKDTSMNAAHYPKLLDRFPFDKRGGLISITVQDHYVEITTNTGTELVVMRLVDAIAETAPTAGLQVHRSHWVALDAVHSVRRDGAKAIIALNDGRDIPASRTYMPALKEVGLLPK